MKYILTFFIALTFPLMLQAEFTGPSEQQATSAVSDVQSMKDGMQVVLEGKIEKQISKGEYLFNDGTDTITVKIDEDVWNGLNVSEKDKVRIFGEVDRSILSNVKIDVEQIEVISLF
ncbi:MAG: NirD/YgiW/YdeI family stress tolerance protein [Alphaproteobacteria bacterium]|jgi:uncharacterized protein (TIGR00156 family)|nr:NirD/YgiW/YdeI family stress tolerance protein [Alphaproteobacteria bacterium]